jgi:hypothetical protein
MFSIFMRCLAFFFCTRCVTRRSPFSRRRTCLVTSRLSLSIGFNCSHAIKETNTNDGTYHIFEPRVPHRHFAQRTIGKLRAHASFPGTHTQHAPETRCTATAIASATSLARSARETSAHICASTHRHTDTHTHTRARVTHDNEHTRVRTRVVTQAPQSAHPSSICCTDRRRSAHHQLPLPLPPELTQRRRQHLHWAVESSETIAFVRKPHAPQRRRLRARLALLARHRIAYADTRKHLPVNPSRTHTHTHKHRRQCASSRTPLQKWLHGSAFKQTPPAAF